MAKQGDLVEVTCKYESIKGVLMPSKEEFVVVKLESGYNIGIAKRNIKSIKSLGKPKSQIKKTVSTKTNKNLPKVTILHTGGTFASKVDYSTGAVIAKFKPEELMAMFPEIGKLANINSRLVRNMQSEMIRFAHYNILAKEIEKETKKGAKGVVITHGTDTLHYTAAALSFILENINIPVILVGAQRSSDRPSSDSAANLISALTFITQTKISGVFICMHENMNDDKCVILPGCKAKKMHTSRRDAFKPINASPIARVDYKKNTVEIINKDILIKSTGKLKLKLIKENLKIGLIEAHIQMFAEEFLSYKNYDGLVIELLGIGHIPTMKVDEYTAENEKILKAVEQLAKKMPVVAAPQTIYGRINMNVYTPGRQLLEAGVLGNYTDMTPETAFIKLAWLLSNYKKEEVKELVSKNLRGEISERTEKNNFC